MILVSLILEWAIGSTNNIFAQLPSYLAVLSSTARVGEAQGKPSREMRDVAVAGEDCVRVLGPGPAARAYEEG